jgi:hypothetical protein
MRIRREEIDGEEVIVTPCSSCLFYSRFPKPACVLGRIDKYEALGKVIHIDEETVEVKTFCNHARPVPWQGADDTIQDCVARVIEDNHIGYDLIVRIQEPEDVKKIQIFADRTNPPQNIILSFEKINVGEVVDYAYELGVDFELIQIKDMSARTNCELSRVQATWSETVDLSKEYSVDLMDQFEYCINTNLEQIVAVIGDQYIIMSMLISSFDAIGLQFNFDNIEEVAGIQDNTKTIRRFDGKRICHYSKP